MYLTTALILIATASVISSTNGSDGSVHENPAICTKYKEDGKTISMKSQVSSMALGIGLSVLSYLSRDNKYLSCDMTWY